MWVSGESGDTSVETNFHKLNQYIKAEYEKIHALPTPYTRIEYYEELTAHAKEMFIKLDGETLDQEEEEEKEQAIHLLFKIDNAVNLNHQSVTSISDPNPRKINKPSFFKKLYIEQMDEYM